MDEDALLQQALAMSMAVDEPAAAQAPAEQPKEPTDASMFDVYDEELQNAIKMSMAEVQPGESSEKPADAAEAVSLSSKLRLQSALRRGYRNVYPRGDAEAMASRHC